MKASYFGMGALCMLVAYLGVLSVQELNQELKEPTVYSELKALDTVEARFSLAIDELDCEDSLRVVVHDELNMEMTCHNQTGLFVSKLGNPEEFIFLHERGYDLSIVGNKLIVKGTKINALQGAAASLCSVDAMNCLYYKELISQNKAEKDTSLFFTLTEKIITI